MNSVSEDVEKLEKSLETLLEKFLFLKKENQILQQRNFELSQTLEQKKSDLSDLEVCLENVKIAKSIVGSDLANMKVKQTISALIKEVDKCIEGLSLDID